MRSRTASVEQRWWFVGVALVALSVGLALRSASLPQDFDAGVYLREATLLRSGAVPPEFGDRHNYGYATWLAALQTVGLGSRAGVAMAQTGLMVGAVGVAARMHRAAPGRLFALLTLTVSVPVAWCYSGYALSEAVVAPVTLLLLTAMWGLVLRAPERRRVVWASAGAGIASGALWALRPGLFWIPFAVAVLCSVGHLVSRTSERRPRLRSIGLGGIVLAASASMAIPQVLFARQLGASFADGIMHVNPATVQIDRSPAIWRYVTNVSDCGDAALVFSPHGASQREAIDRFTADHTLVDRFLSSVAHLVNAFDPLPSPSYASTLRPNAFVVLTLASGFLLVPTLRAVDPRRLRSASAHVVVLFLWSAVAVLSLAAMVPTGAEYRYGVVAAVAMGAVAAVATTSADRPSLPRWILSGALISVSVLLFGLWTLFQSDTWRTCTGL